MEALACEGEYRSASAAAMRTEGSMSPSAEVDRVWALFDCTAIVGGGLQGEDAGVGILVGALNLFDRAEATGGELLCET